MKHQAGVCTAEMLCSRDLCESEIKARAGPGKDGSKRPSPFQMPWGTQCWGNVLTWDLKTDRTNHPSCSRAPDCNPLFLVWRRPPKGGVPVLLYLGQRRVRC